MKDRRVPKKGEPLRRWVDCEECGNPCTAWAKQCGSCGILGPICFSCLSRKHTFCDPEAADVRR